MAKNKQKKIAVFFKQPGAKAYPFNKEEYWFSYQELNRAINKLGAQFYIVRDNKTYLGNGNFSESWQIEGNDIIETGKIKVDVIYDKGEFLSDGKIPILNSEFINEICTNKWKTYEMFREFCPKTFLAQDESEFLDALSRIQGNKKVIKPPCDEEGHGVYIGDDEYLKTCPKEYPIMVQEFLDTRSGIPGVYKGIHDLRIVVINGEIFYSFYRTPPKGKLLANVAQGGDLKIIKIEKIPKSVLNIVDIIDQKIRRDGDYVFGVDVGFVNDEPKIIELNSRVALFSPKRGQCFVNFVNKIAEILVK